MPAAMASPGEANVTARAVELDRTGGRPVDAEQHAGDLGAPAADQAAEAQDLAGADRRARRRRRRRRGRGPSPPARRRRARPSRCGYMLLSARPTIRRTARSRGSSRDRRRGDQLPVAQHGDPVGDAVDLVHAVADEHHRHALPAQVVDHGEQPVDLALRQGGGRLVHDQHAGAHRQRAGDLDQLLLGAAQAGQRRLRARSRGRPCRAGGQRPAASGPVEQAQPAPAGRGR